MDNRASVLIAPIREISSFARDPIEERSLGASAVESRRKEFHAGRALARILLKSNGVTPGPIPIEPNRLPAWPRGIVASISHTKTHAAVALATSKRVKALGLDIECHGAVSPNIESQVLCAIEQRETKGTSRSATQYFCAKEAAFKACFPLHNEYFDFTDVLVNFCLDRFQCTPMVEMRSSDSLTEGSGLLGRFGDHHISLFLLEYEADKPNGESVD